MINESHIVDHKPTEEIIDISSLDPKSGFIVTRQGGNPVEAIYVEKDGNVLAYTSFEPYSGSLKRQIIESFTNAKLRNLGVQKRISSELVTTLRERGVESIIGMIQLDNSPSLNNRLSMKSEDGKYLRVEISGLSDIENSSANRNSIDSEKLMVEVFLNESVDDNEELKTRIRSLQKKLNLNRSGMTL